MIAADLTGQLQTQAQAQAQVQVQVQLHHKQFASFPEQEQMVGGVDGHAAGMTAGADTYG